jgi:hypothetical protein
MVHDDGLALAAAILQAASAALSLVQLVPVPLQDHSAANACAQLLDLVIAGHPVVSFGFAFTSFLCGSWRYE